MSDITSKYIILNEPIKSNKNDKAVIGNIYLLNMYIKIAMW